MKQNQPKQIALSTAGGIAYRISEASLASGIGRTTLYSLIGKGELPIVKIGTRTLIRRIDIESLLARNLVTTDPQAAAK